MLSVSVSSFNKLNQRRITERIKKMIKINKLKKCLRSIIICIFVVFIIFCEYKLFDCKKFTRAYCGKVIHSFVSTGRRSSTCLATVAFDEGGVEELNTGHYLYNIGDRFCGQLSWDWFLGLSGTAYAYVPTEYNFIFPIVAGLCNILIGFVIIAAIIFGIYKIFT